MERKFFESQIAALSLNYRQKVDMKTVDLYWDHFRGVSQEDFCEAVTSLIAKEEYFPTIAAIKRHLPKSYPDFKQGWPGFVDLEKARRTSISMDCAEIVFMKIEGRMSKEEYYQKLMDLDAKYPGIYPFTFRQAAEMYIKGIRKQ